MCAAYSTTESVTLFVSVGYLRVCGTEWYHCLHASTRRDPVFTVYVFHCLRCQINDTGLKKRNSRHFCRLDDVNMWSALCPNLGLSLKFTQKKIIQMDVATNCRCHYDNFNHDEPSQMSLST